MGQLESGIEQTDQYSYWKRLAAGSALATIAISISPVQSAEAYANSEYACDVNAAGFSKSVRERFADECVRSSRFGETAIISYGISPSVVTGLGPQLAAELIDATDGVKSSSFTVLEASDFSKAFFAIENPVCDDTSAIDFSAAMIADKHMDLSAYDHVIALTNKPNCNDNKTSEHLIHFGNTWSNDAMRYGEIFQADTMDQHKGPGYLKQTIIHEREHMDGLNHAGLYRMPDARWEHIDGRRSQFPMLSDDAVIDIPNLIANPRGIYEECGSRTNVMGVKYMSGHPFLNSSQRHYLNWANIETSNVEDTMHHVNTATVLLMDSLSRNHDFGEYTLATPIEFTQDSSIKYDRIVIDPYVDDTGSIPGLVEVYLSTDTRDSLQTMSLGYLDLRSPEQSNRVLRIGDQQLSVVGVDGGIYVGPATNVMTR